MKKEKNSVSININSKDETKSQIVYNNIISNMEKMSFTKEEQLEYLKVRIAELEQEHKNKFHLIALTVIFTFILMFGLFLIIQDFYTVGIIVSFIAFFFSIITIYKVSREYKSELNNKFEEIEAIRKLINDRLK